MRKIFFALTALLAFVLIAVNASAKEAEYNGYIVKLRDRVSLFSNGETAGRERQNFITVDSPDDIPDYIDDDEIEYIEPNYTVELFANPNDAYYEAYQWNMKMINAPDFWESGCFGQGIKIAIIDTGICALKDLTPNLLEGYNYVDKNTDTNDDNGHGTFIAGIIASQINNSFGFAGLAGKAKIVPLKCFSANSTTDTNTISQAIVDAVNIYNCNVINLSLGTGGYSQTMKEAVDYAISKGAVVVAACGNEGTSELKYPASYPEVISVSAVDADKSYYDYDKKVCYSNYNEYVDVAAPGTGVYSYSVNGKAAIGSGTSFAAPLVSAMAALCLNVNPDMTCSDFDRILSKTCEDLGTEGRDVYYGYGLLNAKSILENLLCGTECFISPYDFDGEAPYAVAYNNTDSSIEVLSILTEETGRRLSRITMPSKAGVNVSAGESGTSFKNYIWGLNLRPIYKREHN